MPANENTIWCNIREATVGRVVSLSDKVMIPKGGSDNLRDGPKIALDFEITYKSDKWAK